MNKLSVCGRLTRDVEIKDVNGRNCASFGVASKNKHKNRETGEYGTNFYTVTAWGAAADTAARFLKKGHRVALTGDLVYREYTGNDGMNHGVLEINNAEITLIETASETGNNAPTAAAPAPTTAPQQPVNTNQLPF